MPDDSASRLPSADDAARLRRLSLLLDNIIESVPLGIIAVGPDGRVLAINANAELLFGVRRVLVLGESVERALPAEISAVIKSLSEKLEQGAPQADEDLEITLPRAGGLRIGVSAGALFNRDGAAEGSLFVCRDMSLSREVARLRELDQMKAEFLNTVSHELKTPLTAIMAGVELLRTQETPQSAPLLEVLNSAAERLRDMITDMLDLSRLESGRAQLVESECDPGEVAREAISRVEPGPQHRLRSEVGQALGNLRLDRVKIVHALCHLLRNAVKYSPAGGEIVLAMRAHEGAFELSVSDRGIGISSENLEKLFKKFYRVDASYTSDTEGTGLGLAIVKRIAELHGGSVFVRSELGRGSTFGIRLPLRARASETTVAAGV